MGRAPGVKSAKNGPHVLVVGAGFAGLSTVSRLARAGFRVTLADRHIYSTFQPLLYQVATAGLAPSDVAYPLRGFAHKYGARFRHGDLAQVDTAGRVAEFADGESLEYDYLILATGVTAGFFGITGAAEYSHALYTLHDAATMRARILAGLERLSLDGVRQGRHRHHRGRRGHRGGTGRHAGGVPEHRPALLLPGHRPRVRAHPAGRAGPGAAGAVRAAAPGVRPRAAGQARRGPAPERDHQGDHRRPAHPGRRGGAAQRPDRLGGRGGRAARGRQVGPAAGQGRPPADPAGPAGGGPGPDLRDRRHRAHR